jgi:hypothetical protein
MKKILIATTVALMPGTSLALAATAPMPNNDRYRANRTHRPVPVSASGLRPHDDARSNLAVLRLFGSSRQSHGATGRQRRIVSGRCGKTSTAC